MSAGDMGSKGIVDNIFCKMWGYTPHFTEKLKHNPGKLILPADLVP